MAGWPFIIILMLWSVLLLSLGIPISALEEQGAQNKSCSHTYVMGESYWWMTDLEDISGGKSNRIPNRWECCNKNFINFTADVSKDGSIDLAGFSKTTAGAVCLTRVEPVTTPYPVTFQCDQPVRGRYIKVVMDDKVSPALTQCKLDIFDKEKQQLAPTPEVTKLEGSNVAINKPAKQAGTDKTRGPNAAVDENILGNLDEGTCAEVKVDSGWQWWIVDLKDFYTINFIRLTTRYDSPDKLSNFTIEVSLGNPGKMQGFPGKTNASVCMALPVGVTAPYHVPYACDKPVTGRFVRVLRYAPRQGNYLTICDLQVFGTPAPNAGPKELTVGDLWDKWQQWIRKLRKEDQSNHDDCPTLTE